MKRSNLHYIAPSSELLYSSFEFANCIYQKCNSSNCKICLSTSPLQVSCSAVHALEFARNISSNCICICPKYNMYLSLYQNVFVPVTKYICPLQLGCSAVHGLEFAKTSFGSRRPCKGRQSTPAGRQEKASWKDPLCQLILGLSNYPSDLTKKYSCHFYIPWIIRTEGTLYLTPAGDIQSILSTYSLQYYLHLK